MNSSIVTFSSSVRFSVVEALQSFGYYSLHRCTLPYSLAADLISNAPGHFRCPVNCGISTVWDCEFKQSLATHVIA